MLNGKYIVFENRNPFCFPETLPHSEIAAALSDLCGKPTSAGQFTTNPTGGKFICWGESMTLGLRSNKERDEYLMNMNFGVL